MSAGKLLYDEQLEQPPRADRLRAMINALAGGAEIDDAMRRELIDALKRHEVRLANDATRSKRGREIEYYTWFAAAITRELIDRFEAASVYDAANAATKSARWERGLDPERVTVADVDAVMRAYQKLNKSPDGYIALPSGEKFTVALIMPEWIEDAVARLNNIDRSVASSGNSLGVIAKLINPITD